ncbi:hypothetical protein SEUCBS139899_006886 [Sporothrix eucalyptigena]|uniref:Cytochrome c oxidase subunit 7 n=1 Tax=Sporothrix eucalyptigena TaxID=1812306 RepID=A0ABP0AYK2_9PEZI
MGLFNAENHVPKMQRQYQAAYKQHVRIWNIAPRSRVMLVPYSIVLGGTFAVGLYGMGRKVLGYNTFI